MNTYILLAFGLAFPGRGPVARIQGAHGVLSRLGSELAPGASQARSITAHFSATLAAAVLMFFLLGEFSVAVATGIVVATLAGALRGVRATKRRLRRTAATGVFLGHLLGELRAGSGIPQAISAAAETIPEHAPRELRTAVEVTAARTLAGGSGPAVLLDARATVPELAELAQMWHTAEHHGVPLAPLIQEAQNRLDIRTRHRAATTSSLQGPQATAVVLTLLPLAGVGMGSTMGADPLGLLFGGGLGGMLLVAGVGLSCSGFLWTRQIIEGAAK
ncbi:type II secretion system F family protein [Corynebacterium sp. A21]|uniref:type II secretion system F family protein n=1 Tax=Corynebacterium sp. A21 TaxID=3457318 RepID=UPI003FD06A65